MSHYPPRTYCYFCASKLEQKREHSWYCPSCDYVQYESPKPAGEIILYRDGKILAAERGSEPDKGKYDFPGGFIEAGETFEQGIVREAEEELGVSADSIGGLTRLSSFTTKYAYGPEVYDNLVEVYMATLADGVDVGAHDDVAQARWVSEDAIDDIPWARGHHRENALKAFKYFKKQ